MQADLQVDPEFLATAADHRHHAGGRQRDASLRDCDALVVHHDLQRLGDGVEIVQRLAHAHHHDVGQHAAVLRSEEHTSELQSLMRISYAVLCLKKKNQKKHSINYNK